MPDSLTPPCPVCHHTGLQHQLTCTDHLVSGRRFAIQSCVHCGLWRTHPAPAADELAQYYPIDHYISHQSHSGSFFETVYFAARKWMLTKKLTMISRYQKTGRLLDYGCGAGAFVRAAAHSGWDAVGYEPAPQARANAAPDTTIFSDIREAKTTYHVITLWHVLEHLPDPRAALTHIASMLEPGGLLVTAVPNRLSWDARHYQSHWAAYDVPRHLWHFTPADMQQLIQRTGLNLEAQKPLWLDAYYVSLLSEKYRRAHPVIAWPKALLLGSYSNLSAWLKSGRFSSIVYLARKR
jgi:SAM-dependent methyltransferase